MVSSNFYKNIDWGNKTFILPNISFYNRCVTYFTTVSDPFFAQGIKPLIAHHFFPRNALIRFPGTDWFSLLDVDNQVVSIGRQLARSNRTSIDINRYFRSPDIKALLLYTRNVPFELVADTVFEIIPMDRGHYYIESLTIRNDSIDALYRSLMVFYFFEFMNLYIKKCTVAGNVFNNMCIFYAKDFKKVHIFFTDSDGKKHLVVLGNHTKVYDEVLTGEKKYHFRWLQVYEDQLKTMGKLRALGSNYLQKQEIDELSAVIEKKQQLLKK